MILALFALLGALTLDWEKYIYSMMFFGIFEGQGRVLTGYNPVFRLLFDLLLVIGIARVFIRHKKIYSSHLLPKLIYFMIFTHFLWWTMELFNPIAAGPLASFATAKYYIFPFLLFFSHLLEPIDVESKTFNTFALAMMFIISVECILCIFQMSQGSDYMAKVSPNYSGLFSKFKEFEGLRFRPWGTSHNPGGMSQYIFLTLPLILLIDPKKFSTPKKARLFNVLLYVFIALCWFTMFISQVRSAWLKHILITVITAVLAYSVSQEKLKKTISFIFAIVTFTGIGFFGMNQFPSIQKTLDLTSSLSRLENLQRKGIGEQREGFTEIANQLSERVIVPFGFGPGMCTGYLPHFGRRRNQLIDIPSWHFWALDNWYAFSILELGLGAIFYIGSIFTIMLFTLLRTIVLLRRRHFDKVRVLTPVVTVFIVIAVGNWGAIALPFNPESFYFWLYTSIGVITAFGKKPEPDIQIDNDAEDEQERHLELVPTETS